MKYYSPGVIVSNNVITGNGSSSYGVKLSHSDASAIIDNNQISGFSSTYGVWLAIGTTTVQNNQISNSLYGIYVNSGPHTIGSKSNGNEIWGNTAGIYVACAGPGTCPSVCAGLPPPAPVVRYNHIRDNEDGVVAEKTAAVDLGMTTRGGNPKQNYGNNTIVNNTGSCVSNTSSCGTVSAVGNYWGGCPPPDCALGDVDMSKALCKAPKGAAPFDEPGDDRTPQLPDKTALLANVPNPFNPSTRIYYDLATPGTAEIAIYDVLGRQVLAHNLGYKSAGSFAWTWDGRDARGGTTSSGVYYIVLKLGGKVVGTRKAVMLK